MVNLLLVCGGEGGPIGISPLSVEEEEDEEEEEEEEGPAMKDNKGLSGGGVRLRVGGGLFTPPD